VRYWSADEDFGRAAEAALLDLFGRKPSRGYVRGSMAPPDVPRETTIVTMDKTPAPDANHANPNRDDQTTAPELQGLRTALEAFAVEIGAFEHNRYVTKPLTLLDVFVETHYSFHAGLAPTDFLCLVLEVYNARIVKPDEHKLLNELVALRLLEPRLSLKPTTGRFSSATLFVLSALGQDFAAQIRALRAHQMMEHFHSPESD
jgi:hypothetical protein